MCKYEKKDVHRCPGARGACHQRSYPSRGWGSCRNVGWTTIKGGPCPESGIWQTTPLTGNWSVAPAGRLSEQRLFPLFPLAWSAVPSSDLRGMTGGPDVKVLRALRTRLESDLTGERKSHPWDSNSSNSSRA